jgi:hypothetical protein
MTENAFVGLRPVPAEAHLHLTALIVVTMRGAWQMFFIRPLKRFCGVLKFGRHD